MRTQADREFDWNTGRELERKDAEISQLRLERMGVDRVVASQLAEIERLTAYQNETAKAWTKLTESQEEEIANLKAEVVKWQIEAGKFGAGCPACDDIGEENERLRAALATVHVFIEGEMIAHAVTVPEGARADDPKNPTLLQVVERALGLDEQYGRKED